MHDWESLSHVRWECKYQVIIIPPYSYLRARVWRNPMICIVLRSDCDRRVLHPMGGKNRCGVIRATRGASRRTRIAP